MRWSSLQRGLVFEAEERVRVRATSRQEVAASTVDAGSRVAQKNEPLNPGGIDAGVLVSNREMTSEMT
jgi:hypothetical protein